MMPPYLWLYGIRHIENDHSGSKRGNPLPHRLLFPISSKELAARVWFICTIPFGIAYTITFVIPVVDLWLEQVIAQWVYLEE